MKGFKLNLGSVAHSIMITMSINWNVEFYPKYIAGYINSLFVNIACLFVYEHDFEWLDLMG